MEIPSLIAWVFTAWSPDGLQCAQPRAGLYYKLVNNSVLDGLLKELIYPGLFANLGYEAQPRPRWAEPFWFHHQWQNLPFGLVPGRGAG